MSVIHHTYRHFHIYFQDKDNHYHVTHDHHPEWADEHLHHHSIKQAKQYVDVCCDVLYGFVMEPQRSMLFLPFYRCGYRSDGPLPIGLELICTEKPPQRQFCQHVWCNVNRRNMGGGSLWQYCGNPTVGTNSRCAMHC